MTLKERLDKLSHKQKIRFAYECVLSVKSLIADEGSLNALKEIEEWLNTSCNEEKDLKAHDSATDAASCAAYALHAGSAAAAAAAFAYSTFATIDAETLAKNASIAASNKIKQEHNKILENIEKQNEQT